jgi:hypothetical protein
MICNGRKKKQLLVPDQKSPAGTQCQHRFPAIKLQAFEEAYKALTEK